MISGHGQIVYGTELETKQCQGGEHGVLEGCQADVTWSGKMAQVGTENHGVSQCSPASAL